MGKFLHRIFSIDAREAEFSRRGFVWASAEKRERLERAGKTFLRGYHAGLAEDHKQSLAEQLEQIDNLYRGFAYEGAAMALALRDGFTPGGNRFLSFAEGAGKHHIYMLHVGAGWAFARLPWLRWRMEKAMREFHPVLRWLAVDGYGFHEGYFHWPSRIGEKLLPLNMSPTKPHVFRHVFHQGLGRSLWFVNGADATRIGQTISGFDLLYHGDLWSGIGLACAYAGGMDALEIEELMQRAGAHRPALAQGAAFAAKARQLALTPAEHTETACALLCGMSAASAAALCDQTLDQTSNLPGCAYQQWRELLQQHLSASFFRSSEMFLRGKSNESIRELVPSKPH